MQKVIDKFLGVTWWQISTVSIATLIATLTVMWGAYLGLRALWRRISKAGRPGEDILTIVAASIATGVSAQGMWRFSGDVLGFDGPLQLLLFAFIEVAVVTSAVRARRNMRENFSAGIDGAAVWALTSLSAVLSSMDARIVAEAVFRLAAPLVAAWLWERGMAIERHRITGRARIRWRLTPERAMVRLGLADATDRTAGEVDTQRRLTRIALAAGRAHDLREEQVSEGRQRRAVARMKRAYAAAHAHTGLGRNEDLQEALATEVRSLRSALDLLDLEPRSAWTPEPSRATDAVEAPEMPQEARQAIAAYEGWKRPKILRFPVMPPLTPLRREMSALVSAGVSSNGGRVNGHAHTLPHTPAAPASVVSPTPPVSDLVSDPVSSPPTRERPLGDGEVLTVPHTALHTEPLTDTGSESDQPSEQDDEESEDRRRVDEQLNDKAEAWIRGRCRGTNGVGRKPSYSEVGNRYDRSAGWGGSRVRAVQERMTAQGYVFTDDGSVTAPTRPHTADEASTDSAEE